MHDAISRWLSHLERTEDLADTTLDAYQRDMTHFARWWEKTEGRLFEPAAITPPDIKDYRSHIRRTGGRGGSAARPTTINRKLSSLRSFFAWASQEAIVPDNPTQNIKMWRATEQTVRWLGRDEQRRLRAAVRTPGSQRDHAIIVLMLNTGLRVGEVGGLHADSIESLRMVSGDLSRLTARAESSAWFH